MALNTVLKGIRRAISNNTAGGGDGSENFAAFNEKNELLVAYGLPPYTEMARKGQGWSVMTTSAVAALVVRPSTVANVELWNGEAAGGLSYIIDRSFFHNLVSTAVNSNAIPYYQVTASKAAPSTASLAVAGNTGKQTYGGKAIVAIGTTVIASGWFPFPLSPNYIGPNAAAPGGGDGSGRTEGRIIVPPGSSLCLHMVASIVGDTFNQGVSWFEELLTNN